ncbi:MAG: 50S ribosomal protein L30 [Akkermansiaceae bacterium]|nr:50S ribosomal protein L30 [Armatimonadota bacterium]
MAQLKITQIKSAIGYEKSQGLTVRSLGLRRIRHSVIQTDNGAIRGMIHKVRHLVTFEEVAEGSATGEASASSGGTK